MASALIRILFAAAAAVVAKGEQCAEERTTEQSESLLLEESSLVQLLTSLNSGAGADNLRSVSTHNVTVNLLLRSKLVELADVHTSTSANTHVPVHGDHSASDLPIWWQSKHIQTTMLWMNGVVLAVLFFVVLRVALVRSRAVSSEECREDQSIMQAILPILLWASLGISVIVFNKYLFMSTDKGGFGFPCPMTLTWCQMFVAFIATNFIRLIRPQLMPAIQEQTLTISSYTKVIIPIGIIFGAYLAIGNSAYLYLSVHFVQMLKSAGPIAVHVMAVTAGMERISVASVTAIAIIVAGVFGASVGEVAFSWFGFALQMTAMVLDGVRLLLLKLLMSSGGLNLDPLSGLYCYAPVCVFSLLGPAIYFEGAKLQGLLTVAPWYLCWLILANSILAFALNVSLLSLFARVGATTISVASVIRDVLLAFGSAALFHTEISHVQALGYFSACLGVKLWDEIKARPDAFNTAFGLSQGAAKQ